MEEKILVPVLGESITEATVSKWLKNQGESVVADEPVVELETDKVNVEVPAPSNGTLEKISVKEGETVNVGSLLGLINGSQTKKDTLKVDNDFSSFLLITDISEESSPPLKAMPIGASLINLYFTLFFNFLSSRLIDSLKDLL
mgnify:CR=1 FL=1